MNEYTSTYKLFIQLVSIKRALWVSVVMSLITFTIFIALGSYGGALAYAEMEDITRTIGATARSQNLLEQYIKESLQLRKETEKHVSLVLRSSNNVMLKINTYPYQKQLSPSKIVCPASSEYEAYLKMINDRDTKPIVHNVYMFYGKHGLGKSYAAEQLARAMSRFDDTVLISVPMNNYLHYGGFNSIGDILQGIEQNVKRCNIIWLFDELDSFLQENRDALYSKDITQFAEYTGFVKNDNRLLAFTMNNADIIKHDYWAAKASIENNTYEFIKDFNSAVKLTRMNRDDFLIEGQLSRLRSFIGNKLFEFKEFDKRTAKHFMIDYIQSKNINLSWNTKIEKALFGEADTFSVRTLLIKLDDVLNEMKIVK